MVRADDKRTCMHLAASEGVRHIVTMLVELGGDVNAKDRWGGTPLSDAIREGHSDVAKIIISCGGLLNMDDTQAAGMLCEYARAGEIDKMGMMLSGGCDQNAADCTSSRIEPEASNQLARSHGRRLALVWSRRCADVPSPRR